MGQPALVEDPRFATPTARSAHEDEMDSIINGWTGTLPLKALERVLEEASVPASRIFNLEDIFADPHYRARDMMAMPVDPKLGPVAMANVVPRLSRTPGQVHWAGHDIGQDTADVLESQLGLDSSEIEQLIEAGIIHVHQSCPQSVAEEV
jgi:crotonobetainyl-CoA:carnitine CoA-transferase CaiB-like acyl-CoA transferase